ncbi:hypothetical protein [Burkholderia ubonensis]|uniref:hypothetical protein n=1 Tax=Burkholderia ubonensis TaxID=101571 RepID=UPI0012F9DA48|nr:hypothetical protein [Burkholderia ubonensis]
MLASKQNDPLPILVPIPPVQILLGETFQLIIDDSPYGTPVLIPPMDIGRGDVTILIAPQDRPGGNPNRRYQVTYRYVGGGYDETWPTPIPFIVDLIASGNPGALASPVSAYGGIDPGDEVLPED